MNAALETIEMFGRPALKVPDDYQRATALKCKSEHQALIKTVEISDLPAKQIYGPLGIEQSQWSRIIAGTAFLNPELRSPLMQVCGNDVLVIYGAWKQGYELTRIKTDLEARVAQLEAELIDERRVTKRLGEMLRGL